jgi:rhodanese-related sulfurtransferase
MFKSFLFKKLIYIIIALFILIQLTNGQKESDSTMMILNVEEFIIQMKLHDNYILLDVRSWIEYKNGRIPHAILAEDSNVLFSIADTIDVDQPLFLYCAKNFRSKSAGRLLAEKGFINIHILEVGFNGWKAAGEEIDNSKIKKKYIRIRA